MIASAERKVEAADHLPGSARRRSSRWSLHLYPCRRPCGGRGVGPDVVDQPASRGGDVMPGVDRGKEPRGIPVVGVFTQIRRLTFRVCAAGRHRPGFSAIAAEVRQARREPDACFAEETPNAARPGEQVCSRARSTYAPPGHRPTADARKTPACRSPGRSPAAPASGRRRHRPAGTSRNDGRLASGRYRTETTRAKSSHAGRGWPGHVRLQGVGHRDLERVTEELSRGRTEVLRGLLKVRGRSGRIWRGLPICSQAV